MALIVDGISPTAIEIDGNSDIKVLEVDGVAYWGKPFTLTINTDTNSNVVVTRTSSPYQNASIGILETGSLVYYGDNLSVEVSATDGYDIDTFKINNISYSIKYQNPANIVVKEAIIVNVTSTEHIPSWVAIWTGSQSCISNKSSTSKEYTIKTYYYELENGDNVRVIGKTYYSNTSFTRQITYTSGSTNTVWITDNVQTQKIKFSKNILTKAFNLMITVVGTLISAEGLIIEKVEVYK